jgi:hypothetical protein
MANRKRTNNDIQNIDRVSQAPLKTGGEFRCSGRVNSCGSTSVIGLVNLVTNPVIRGKYGEVHLKKIYILKKIYFFYV